MSSLGRLARSRTAAAAGAAVLALLLGLTAIGAFPRQPGIDFYQFWGVPLARASANLQATPYTDGPAYAQVLNAMADASASVKLREANRQRRTLEPMGTPFLYAAFAVFPEDYRQAQTLFALIQYSAAWVAVYILARLASAPPWPAACVAFFVLLTFNPFVQDVRVGNVNSVQLLVLVVLVAISSRKAFSGRDWIDGLFVGSLALLVAFKPNTPWIAAAFAIHYFVVRGPRAFAIGAAEAVLLGLAAFAVGAWYMGGAHAWIEWIDLARGMDGSAMALPYERGNLSIAMLLGRDSLLMGSKGYGLVLAGFLALALVMALSAGGRAKAGVAARRALSDPWFAASVGILFTFATSPLVWPHYHMMLLIPIAWLLTRAGSCRACAWGAAACYIVLSRAVIDPLVSMRMFELLQALTLLSWLALLPGVLGYAREAR
jgi:hypothetical protein